MLDTSIGLMHLLVSFLLQPVILGLLLSVALAVWETGTAAGERWVGLARLRRANDSAMAETIGRKRIERADFLARIAPMLGLMGTLIPLGPGLSGLGNGDISVLTSAIRVAFDTTVLGLLAGIAGFAIGRLRRRWYDDLLNHMEASA